jgi:hypothetical protein
MHSKQTQRAARDGGQRAPVDIGVMGLANRSKEERGEGLDDFAKQTRSSIAAYGGGQSG